MDLTVVAYAVYLLISVALTVWVARTLSQNGRIFLADVLHGNEKLADAVNHLLVVGFYMLNLGYAFYILRTAERGFDAVGAVQYFVSRLALLLVTLAVIHFLNVAVFWHIRGRGEQRQMPVPVAPQATLEHRG